MTEPTPIAHAPQEMSIADASVHDGKVESAHVEHQQEKGPIQQMRTKSDDLPILETISKYKLVTLLGFVASFSASLDGYRKFPSIISLPLSTLLRSLCVQKSVLMVVLFRTKAS
jgi:hypothetical protein